MNERQSIIIERLKETRRVDVSTIIENFGVSRRTIKNDVAFLNKYLNQNLIQFENDTITINSPDKLKELLVISEEHTSLYSYKLSVNERSKIIIFFLFCGIAKTSDEMAVMLCVSRNTIIADMSFVRKILQSKSVVLKSRSGHGFELIGKEQNIRNLMISIIFEIINKHNKVLLNILERTENYAVHLDTLSRSIILASEENSIRIDDVMYQKLINLFALSFMRVNNNKIVKKKISEEIVWNEININYVQSVLANQNVVLTKSEKHFLYTWVDYLFSNNEQNDLINKPANEMRVSAFVWEVCQQLGLLSELGYTQYRNLYNHLMSTIYYLKNEKEIADNPFLADIKHLYPEIYDTVKASLYILEDDVLARMTESDMSYIVMHIAAVSEVKKDVKVQLRSIVVCPMGRGVSLLLKSRILKYFDIFVEDLVPVYKANDYKDIDLIISTVPIENVDYPVVVVNQMFLQDDIDLLWDKIEELNKTNQEKAIFRKIESYLVEFQEIIEANGGTISVELDMLNRRFEPKLRRESHSDFFYKLIYPNCLILDYEAINWQDAIRSAGNLLVESGYITTKYVEKMIELVLENGPYIVFMPGFVIAHAGPEDGAISLGVSIIRLKRSIQFEENGINVHFVICLSIPDKTSHVFLLFQIYKCFTNINLFNYLRETTHIEEFINIIKIYEIEDYKETNYEYPENCN